jgi:heme A synthase
VTAMLVLSCEIAVAIAMYRADPSRAGHVLGEDSRSRPLGRWALGAIVWLAAVMWIGGYMTESGAATACEGWPLCNGSALPAAQEHEITHMVHRYLAGTFMVLLAPVVLTAWRERANLRWAGTVAGLLAVLYVAQVTVGALNVWYTFPDALTISHTVIAASIWFTLSAAIALAFYTPGMTVVAPALKKAGAPA